jgi:hypothetical protein
MRSAARRRPLPDGEIDGAQVSHCPPGVVAQFTLGRSLRE